MLNKKALAATAAGAEALYVEDVFSTYLYTGTGSSRSIVNNIDLSGEGGLVWIKSRSAVNFNTLNDTARGAQKDLYTDYSGGTYPETANANGLTAFNADGFSVGSYSAVNENGTTHVSWTFRKAEKFFDVVTYTGNGTTQAINHNLGSTPGCIIIKKRSSASSDGWPVFHRSLTASYRLLLNSTSASSSGQEESWFGNNSTSVAPTSTQFTVGSKSDVNGSGETYVAYLFAHDAGGFGDAGDQSVISCGSFVATTTSTPTSVNLGWEPQFLLVKASTTAGNWLIMDNMRGIPVGGLEAILRPNLSDAEATPLNLVDLTPTGFNQPSGGFVAGETYIYIAIRRGPMKTPEAGTEVFAPVAYTGNSSSSRNLTGFGFPLDLAISGRRTNAANHRVADRLRGASSGVLNQLITNTTGSEDVPVDRMLALDLMDGIKLGADSDVNVSTSTYVMWGFRRAPGFMDVVCYTGTGTARTVSHNLGVAPELMIVKRRNSDSSWYVWGGNMPMTNTMFLEQDSVSGDNAPYFNDTAPTSSVFSVSSFANTSSATYVAYLFASLTGVSKVGSYTGTGADGLQINCGFTSGARFVLIKRTDSANDWHVFDSARGIVSGNDPYLKLNTTGADVTTDDIVDTYSSGFIVNAFNGVNANGGTYIYLAIA